MSNRSLHIAKNIAESEILNEFRKLTLDNCDRITSIVSTQVRKAKEHGFDGMELLHKALSEKYDTKQVNVLTSPTADYKTINPIARTCRLCQKEFQNGENGWKGNKRFCKESCTKNDLIICNHSQKEFVI